MPWLRRWLTPARLRYALLTGGVLWGAWILSLLLGQGWVDAAGQPIGTDYLQFYAAGYTVRTGQSDRLYDIDWQAALEREIIGPELTSYHAFITPPFLAWAFVPLSLLSYPVSYAVWSAIGLVLLWLSVMLLSEAPVLRTYLWALTFFPVFAAISFGQNALLTLFLFIATYRLWRRGHCLAAGLVLSLTLYKPQLALGIAVLWALDLRRSWMALVGLAAGGFALATLSFGLLPDASWAYVAFARTILPDLPSWQAFPIWHLHTVRGFWRLLLPGARVVADALTGVLAVAGLWGFVQLKHRVPARLDLHFAGATVLSLWLTPHAMIYDLALLLIPAWVLWYADKGLQHRWRALFAVTWLAVLLSGPLTHMQLQVAPLALQVSVPVLAWVYLRVYRSLTHSLVTT